MHREQVVQGSCTTSQRNYRHIQLVLYSFQITVAPSSSSCVSSSAQLGMTHLLLSTLITSSLDTRLASAGTLIIIVPLDSRTRATFELDTTSLPLVEASTCPRPCPGRAGHSDPTSYGMDAFHACMNWADREVRFLLIEDLGRIRQICLCCFGFPQSDSNDEPAKSVKPRRKVELVMGVFNLARLI